MCTDEPKKGIDDPNKSFDESSHIYRAGISAVLADGSLCEQYWCARCGLAMRINYGQSWARHAKPVPSFDRSDEVEWTEEEPPCEPK